MEVISTKNCDYCGKKLVQPIVKHHNRNYHLECYMKKDGSKIFTKAVMYDMTRRLDDMGRRIEFMAQICDNALDNKSSFEDRQKKYQEIRIKYADLSNKRSN